MRQRDWFSAGAPNRPITQALYIAMRYIDIEWEGPFSVPYDRNEDEYGVPELPADLVEDARLYCIYGRHPVYGASALLYIGETKKSDSGRNILKRLKEHFSGRFWYHTELQIHLGKAYQNKRRVGQKTTIKAIESLLIAAHMPALNRRHIDKPIPAAMDLHIVNFGFTGSLAAECSGRAFEE